MQAKDLADAAVLARVPSWDAPGIGASATGLAAALGVPEKIVRAKLRRLKRRGLVSGCACGCRGDWVRKP